MSAGSPLQALAAAKDSSFIWARCWGLEAVLAAAQAQAAKQLSTGDCRAAAGALGFLGAPAAADMACGPFVPPLDVWPWPPALLAPKVRVPAGVGHKPS